MSRSPVERNISTARCRRERFDERRSEYLPLPKLTSLMQKTAQDFDLTRFYFAVEEYSRRHLSFRKDTLPGLSGLANRLYQHHPDDYLAGLWRRQLFRGLCWEKEDEPPCPGYEEHPLLLSEYVAPSWSWASVSTRVRIVGIYTTFKPAADILSGRTTLLGSDPFGQVSAGEIKMRAWINECKLHWLDGRPDLGTRLSLTRHPISSPIGTVRLDGYEDQPDSGQQVALTCILLGTDDSSCYGLALQIVDATSKTYRRIGFFRSCGAASEDGAVGMRETEDMIKEGEFKEIRLI